MGPDGGIDGLSLPLLLPLRFLHDGTSMREGETFCLTSKVVRLGATVRCGAECLVSVSVSVSVRGGNTRLSLYTVTVTGSDAWAVRFCITYPKEKASKQAILTARGIKDRPVFPPSPFQSRNRWLVS